jgi:hypothetical protein
MLVSGFVKNFGHLSLGPAMMIAIMTVAHRDGRVSASVSPVTPTLAINTGSTRRVDVRDKIQTLMLISGFVKDFGPPGRGAVMMMMMLVTAAPRDGGGSAVVRHVTPTGDGSHALAPIMIMMIVMMVKLRLGHHGRLTLQLDSCALAWCPLFCAGEAYPTSAVLAPQPRACATSVAMSLDLWEHADAAAPRPQ